MNETIEIFSLPLKTTALNLLMEFKLSIPMSTEKPCTIPSNSELRRWCQGGSVVINGKKINNPNQVVEYPITSLVFFPKGNRKTTVI